MWHIYLYIETKYLSYYKIFIDFQKRVTIRRHNYFYKPIDGTPFSLGLALPEGYGMFELQAEQEIKLAIINGKFSIIAYYCMLLKKIKHSFRIIQFLFI